MSANLTAKIDLDAQSFIKSIEDSQKEIKRLQKELESARKKNEEFSKAAKDTGTGMDESTAKMAKLANQMLNSSKSSGTAQQQYRKLQREIVNLTVSYRNLTDEEKNSALGQQLAQQIDKMTQKAADLKDVMADVASEITHRASDTYTFDAITQGINLATNAASTLTGVLGLNEKQQEKLNKVLAVFTTVQSLNNTLSAARVALDRQTALGQVVLAAKTKLTAIATTAFAAATNGASTAMKGFKVALASTGVGALVVALGYGISKLIEFTNKTEDAIDKQKELQDLIGSKANEIDDGEWLPEDASRVAQLEQQINDKIKEREKLYKNRDKNVGGYFSADDFINGLNKEITKLKQEKKNIEDLYKADYTPTKNKTKSGSGKGGTSKETPAIVGSISYYEQQLSKEQEVLNKQLVAGTEEWTKQKNLVDNLAFKISRMKEGLSTALDIKVDNVNPINIPIKIAPKKEDLQLSKKTIDSIDKTLNDQFLAQAQLKTDALNNSITNLGSAFSSLGQIIGGTAGDFVSWAAQSGTAVAQMIQQNAQLLASCQAASIAGASKSAFQLPFPYNLAAYATMAATIMGIFASLPKFAEGGIVGGSSYTGDKLLARVNSGEMILNKGQQASLLSQLNGNGSGEVVFKISGNNLEGVLKNYNNKKGRI